MASIPYQYLTATGIIVPDTSDILLGVQTEYLAAFGADLVVTPDTPQGVLITAETLARTEVVNNNAALANQINPNIAAGIFLDAILALTGMQRAAATQTLVSAVAVTGAAGTTIPEGSQAQTAAGDIFASLSAVTLDGSGNATVNFASVVFGPIPCAAHALNQIVTNVLGWETVNNDNAGVVGQNTQSDVSARALRNNTLAFQGVSLAESITSALFNVAGVQSLTFQENIAATTQTINGISMVAHSVYACINGGADVDVAAALLENKSSGAAWNGGTSVTVVEPASGQEYTVLFDRPTPVEIAVRFTSPNAALADLQAGVLTYIGGQVPNYPNGWIVGGDISAFEIAGAVLAQYPYMILNKVEISFASSISYQTSPLTIAVNEIGFATASDVTLVVG